MPCKTTAFPTLGGVVIKHLTAVELEYLSLSRFESTPSSNDSACEDEFALQLLRLGAEWWTDILLFDHHLQSIRSHSPYDFHFPPSVHVGYPSTGGVLVLKYSQDPGVDEEWRKPDLPPVPEGLRAKLNATFTMDERCYVLRDFSAQFYATADECPDILKGLEEAHERAKRFETLLLRMENAEYVDHWFDTGEPLFCDDGEEALKMRATALPVDLSA